MCARFPYLYPFNTNLGYRVRAYSMGFITSRYPGTHDMAGLLGSYGEAVFVGEQALSLRSQTISMDSLHPRFIPRDY